MLTDEQHERLKRLVYKSRYGTDKFERASARNDIANIIDPAHFENGNYYKCPRAT